MSDTTADTTPEAPAQESDADTPKVEIDWKAKAREWERRAKENKGAADKLSELEEANKTEAQRLESRAQAAESELATVRQNALRTEIALDKGLTASQAKRLIGTSREELEADAAELVQEFGEAGKPRAPKPDPNQGRNTVGTSSTADMFAAAIDGSFTR